jgi:hypothetical protein
MFDKNSPFIPTIVIVEDMQAHLRGYSLLGREFILKYPAPYEDEAVTLDGARIRDKYWVVSKKEYLKVVPESPDFAGDDIYLPLFVAKFTFRPRYIKATHI